jgi:hypothetical protein
MASTIAAQMVGAHRTRPAGLGVAIPDRGVDRAHVFVANIQLAGVYVPDNGSNHAKQGDEDQEYQARHSTFVTAELFPHVPPLIAGFFGCFDGWLHVG